MPTYHPRDKTLFDVWKVRKDFPMLSQTMHGKSLIYLDTAATAQKPTSVIEAITHFYQREYGTVHRAVYEIGACSTKRYSEVRKKVRQLINAREDDEIVFTRGTTESINLVARSFGKAFVREGDEIIISETEHHSNIVPWQLVCEQYGAELKVIPVHDNTELDFAAFTSLLTERTKLVSIAHIANATGTIHPIREMTEQAHAVGAKILIDGAQAAAHLPIDVQELNVDFYTFSGHKLYGPTGVGILYGKKELLEELPPVVGGGDMVEEVTLRRATFQKPPLKFEAGTPPIAQVIGLGAAIDYVNSIELREIRDWELQLLRYATKKLSEMEEIRLHGTAREKGGIISFTIAGTHPLDLGTILGLKGVAIRTGHLCAQPTLKRLGVAALARISFGLYSTYEDIDAFLHALKETIILLKPELSY